MAQVHFKKTILTQMQRVQALGYRYVEQQHGSSVVRLEKTLVPGITCSIQFHSKSHIILPNKEFGVVLFRFKAKDFEPKDGIYAFLRLDLIAMVQKHYTTVQLRPDKYSWEFVTKEDFHSELTLVENLLVTYGIPWLEDPATRSSQPPLVADHPRPGLDIVDDRRETG